MEYGITVIGYGQILLRWIFWPFYWWIERTPPKRIPKNDEPLLRVSAKALARKIRNRELRSEDIVRAYIKRINEVNPVLNAVVEDRFDAAIKEAKIVDEAFKNNNMDYIKTEAEKPFLGVPVTIKESCGLAGMSLCVGILSRASEKSPADGDAVRLLRAAGAIPLCVTTTPELCLSWETINLVTGRTLNPYNTHRTPGGSSGGEGALVGAGASVIGLGSDIAGSIRVPSLFNGIFGHKPTGGIVSVNGHYPNSTDESFSTFLVIGPMTRYAEDLKPVLKIISGENVSLLKLDDKVSLNKLTVYYMEELGNKSYDVPVDEDIKEAIVKCVKHLGENCGATISETKFKELYDSLELSTSMFFSVLNNIPNILQNPTNPKENANLTIETIKCILGLSNHALNTLLFYVLKETNSFIPRYKTPMYKKMFEETKKKFEGALVGAGASVIGLGSDIAGSIRVPSLFNGIFGHKPTGGIVSVNGHYPNSTDESFSTFLVIGPMTRYAEDLKPVLKIISGENVSLLKLDDKVSLNKLTVYYMEELGNKSYDVPVDEDIKEAIVKCVKHLGENCGATISETKFKELYDSLELSTSMFFSVLNNIPNILQNPTNPKENANLTIETIKCILGLSNHALNTLLFYVLKETNSFIPRYKTPMYKKMFEETKKKFEVALGTDGVFLFPSFPVPALNHYGLFANISGVSYSMIFNLMGFPATHVPLGLGSNNLPIGLQVIAARNQDKLCLAIAEELEKTFGGWVPPPTAD